MTRARRGEDWPHVKTLHLYLTRQVLASLGLTVMVFTGVLMLGNMLREVLALLVSGQVTFWLVLKAIALLIPYVLVHALPMGMLTATLLVFGRFSADQELTAVRAGGISLVALVTPILMVGLLMTGVCSYVNLELAPSCRVAYKALFTEFATRNPYAPIPEGRFVRDFPGYMVYAGKVNGTNLEDVLFCQFKDGEKVLDIRAEKASLQIDTTSNLLWVEFSQAQVFRRLNPNELTPPPASINPTNPPASTNTPPVTDKAETPVDTGPRWQPVFIPGVYRSEEPIALTGLGNARREPKISEMSFQQLMAKRYELRALGFRDATPVERALRSQVEIQLHRQVSYSLACFGFALVGIPLGIRVHRRETSVGIAVAIVLVLAYYGMTMIAQALQTRAEATAKILMWTPNLLFQLAGAFMLWRANRFR